MLFWRRGAVIAMSGDRLNVTVCGGGRTGHLAAILFKQLKGVEVSLLTGNESVVANHGKNTS